MWLYLLLLLQAVAAKQAQASILLSDYTINAQSSIQLYFFPSDSAAFTETSFTAVFPAFIGFQILQPEPVCYEAPQSQQVSNYNNRQPVCTLVTDKDGNVVLSVSNLRTSGATLPNSYGVQFTGLKNPQSATVSIQNGLGVVVTSYNETEINEQTQANFFQLSPVNSISVLKITSANLMNGALTQLIMNYTVTQMVPINGTVSLNLPYQNEQYQTKGATTKRSMLIQPVNVAVTIQNTSLPQITYAVTGQLIQIQLNNANTVNPGAVVTITLFQTQMPPCNGPLSGFTLTSGDKAFNAIEIVQGILQTNKAGIGSGQISMSSDGILEQNQTYKFTVSMANDLPQDSYFTLVVPDAVELQNSQISCAFECASTYSNKVFAVRIGNQYLQAPGPLEFSISGITNPASTAFVGFKWQSYAQLKEGDFLIDEVTNLTIRAQQGTCTVSQFYPADHNYKIYATPSNWTVQLTCQHSFAVMQVKFPSTFAIDCSRNTCAATANTLLVSNITSKQFALFGITNPSSLNQNPIVVQFNSINQNVLVDSGNFTIPPLTIQPGEVLVFSVAPQDSSFGNFPVYYDFAFQTSGDISTNATIQLILPIQQNQLSLSSPLGFTSSNITVTMDSSVITIFNGFNQSTNQFSMYKTGPVIKFTLGPFKNPRNYDSQSFSLLVNNALGQILYKQKTAIVTMTGPALFKKVTVMRDSDQNSNITNYNFTIIPTNQILASDQLVLQFPPQIAIKSSACFGLSQNLQYNLQCSVSDNKVIVNLQTKRRLQSLTRSYELQITQVKNAASLQPSPSIQVFLYSNNILIEQQTSNIYITNQQPGRLTQVAVMPASFDSASYTNYTFTWQPTEFSPNQTVVIKVPQQLTLGSNVTCSVECVVDKNQITFLNTSSQRNVVTVGPILNPAQGIPMTDSFQVMTYSQQGFLIEAKTSELSINFFCIFPCASCDNFKKMSCNSCYIGSNYSTWFNHSCVSTCPSGLTNIQNNCTTCSSQCSTCQDSANHCLECNAGYFMFSAGRCEEIVYWPFPFIVYSSFAFLVVLIAECRNSSSDFKEGFLALLGIAEFGAWITFTVLSFYKQGLSITKYFNIIAIGSYSLLNIIFAVVHSCKIIRSNPQYKVLMASSKCVRLFSYLVSFKFAAISVSNLCQSKQFKGEYTAQNQKDFNTFLLVFMLSSYPFMMACCVYHLVQFGFFNYAGFLAVECIAISTVAQAVAFMDALSVLSCKQAKAKIGVYKVQSGADYESENDMIKSPLKSKKLSKLNEAQEFGRDDEDPNISKNITNQTLIEPDFHQLIKQLERDRLQDKQLLLDQQKEQLQMIEQVLQLHQAPNQVIQYVDDKMNQADILNKQVLREIYDEQLRMMQRQYRDFEAQMDSQSAQLNSNQFQLIKSERLSVIPLSQFQSVQQLSESCNDEFENAVQNSVQFPEEKIHEATQLTPIHNEQISRGYQTSEVFLNKQKGVFGEALSQKHRTKEFNLHNVQIDATQDLCSSRVAELNKSQLNPAALNAAFESIEVASQRGQTTRGYELQAFASNRGLDKEGSEVHYNLAAQVSNRAQERESQEVHYNLAAQASTRAQEKEGSEVQYNLAAQASNRALEREGSIGQQDYEHSVIAVEQVDSSSGPHDKLSRQSARSQSVLKFQRSRYDERFGQPQQHFDNKRSDLKLERTEENANAGSKQDEQTSVKSDLLSKTKQNVQIKKNLEEKSIDKIPNSRGHSPKQETQLLSAGSPHRGTHIRASPTFAVISSKSASPNPNVSIRSIQKFYDSALQKQEDKSKLKSSPSLQKVQIEDAYGHSESSEGIVNHDLFSTVNHFKYVAPSGLIKTRNQSQPHLSTKKPHVLYSDRSESSVADMMDDTPSNYNIPNGRLDGKSKGLKALVNSVQRLKTPESKSSSRRHKQLGARKAFAEAQAYHQI